MSAPDAIDRKVPSAPRWRIAAIAVLAVMVAVLQLRPWAAERPVPGCPSYLPATGLLIAHGGGGLPDAVYANSRAAIDRAAKHGFRYIELDFTEKDGRLLIWHEGYPESDLVPADLGPWLDAHPDIRIVTDFKTDVLSGLARLRRAVPGREGRFIPEIHAPSQFAAVEALGFRDQILAVYWSPPGDTSWAEPSASLPLFAVALPVERRAQAALTDHPVLLHTVDTPMPGFGLYTDCLVPDRRGAIAA